MGTWDEPHSKGRKVCVWRLGGREDDFKELKHTQGCFWKQNRWDMRYEGRDGGEEEAGTKEKS